MLTAILGYSEMLLNRYGDQEPIRRGIAEIRRAGERAAALTRQLLAFSRRQVLQPKVMDLNAVVRDMDRMLQRLIGEDVALTTVLGSVLGAVRADPAQMEQVILNLAINARDAMPKGGRMTIETRNADVDESFVRKHPELKPGRYVSLAVSDTGVGIDNEAMEHIFEPFFTTKAPGQGTGLGLATVHGIVHQSGGVVWAYSEPGHGTTFKVYLPRLEGRAGLDDSTTRIRASIPHGKETLLLVEDEEVVRDLVRAMLEGCGYRVLSARDGAEATTVAGRHTEDLHLLLTDVVMPEVDGRELADRLKAARPGLRVIFMSGYTDEAIVRHGVLEPGVNFLQKPFTAGALARKVREVLDAKL